MFSLWIEEARIQAVGIILLLQAFVLIQAAIPKLANIEPLVDTLRQLASIPRWAEISLAWFIIVLELFLACGLVSGLYFGETIMVPMFRFSGLLFAGYGGLQAYGIATGRVSGCACFGEKEPLGGVHVARDFVLAGLSAIGVILITVEAQDTALHAKHVFLAVPTALVGSIAIRDFPAYFGVSTRREIK